MAPFDDLEQHDSTPTIPLTDAQKTRMGELATQYDAALKQGYIEASFANNLLELAKELVGRFG